MIVLLAPAQQSIDNSIGVLHRLRLVIKPSNMPIFANIVMNAQYSCAANTMQIYV